MPQRTIVVTERIDLVKLLYPSFIFPLVEINAETEVLFKRWGYCKNLKAKREGSNIMVTHEQTACLQYADEVLGLWFNINKYRRNVSKSYRELIDKLVEMHGELGIATSPNDDVEIFSSIFLSRTTDFHRNTDRWLRCILSEYEDLNRILDLDSYSYIFNYVSNSFQVKQWVAVLKDYFEVRNTIRYSTDAHKVKSSLLRIRFVGPKIAYAYILFVVKDASYAPIDRNFIKFLGKIVSTRTLIGMVPRKELCMMYVCEQCKHREECTLYRVRNAFGHMSGWLQTIAYLHTKTLCSVKRCDICKLRETCLSHLNHQAS